MKIGQFLTRFPGILDGDTTPECDVCALHEQFAKQFAWPLCPTCDKALIWLENTAQWVPVSGSNTNDPQEDINQAICVQCAECQAYVALLPTLVSYNGNHDIYYTGGRAFLGQALDPLQLQALIEHEVTRWLEQRLPEQSLQERVWTLAYGIRNLVERSMAQWLYDQGLKR